MEPAMDEKGKALKGSKRKFSITGQFAPRLVEMLESPAYRVLSLSAHRILSRLEIELGSHAGKDNGRLPATFDQFAEYGISRRLVAPALREVVALGFVKVSERGRAGNAEWRRPSLYRLTYRHTDSTQPTDDWRKIETLEEAEIVAATARDSAQKKTKSQDHKKPQGLGLKVNRSQPVLGAESDTTSLGAESGPTSISRGHRAAGDTARQPASKSGQASGATRRAAVRDLLSTSLHSMPLDSLGDQAFPSKRVARQ
jgi:hypothetical protein